MDKDVIYRQDAIDAINTWDKFGVDERSRIIRWHEGLEPYVHLRDVLTAIVNLSPAQPKPQWIPVTERLPKEGERVLATHLGGLNPNRQVIEHIYERGEFCYGWDMDRDVDSPTFGQRYMGKVIAWMPLPEPWV